MKNKNKKIEINVNSFEEAEEIIKKLQNTNEMVTEILIKINQENMK